MTPSKFRGGEGVERLRGRSTLSSPLSSLLWGGWGEGGLGWRSGRVLVRGGWGGAGLLLNTMLYNIKSITTIHYMFRMVPMVNKSLDLGIGTANGKNPSAHIYQNDLPS